MELAPGEALPALERVLADRAAQRPDGSYTVALLDDPARIGDKVREEADEVARAAAGEPDERVAEEAADVLYHLAVLLRARGMDMPRSRRCSMAVAADLPRVAPGLDEVRELARDYNLDPAAPHLHRRLRDAGLRLPEAARFGPRLPAGVGRAGPARGALLVHRLPPPQHVTWSLGDPGDPYALVADAVARQRQAPLPDLPPFAGGAVGFFGYDLVRTVEPLGSRTPTCSACRTWRSCSPTCW